MSLGSYTFCRSCQQQIIFIRNDATGKSHPVDTKPVLVKVGTLGTYLSEAGEYFTARSIKKPEFGYISHFSTCPQADHWEPRKNKGV